MDRVRSDHEQGKGDPECESGRMMLSASYNNECLVCLTKMRSAACGLRRASATATAYTPDSAIHADTY